MYRMGADERLLVARTRQAELISEARANRLGLSKPDRSRSQRFQGLRLQVGQVLIQVGRTIYEEERPCPDMAA